MEHFEQENQVLREQVASMQTKMEELTSMKTEMEKLAQLVKLMVVTQTQPPPPPPGSTQAEATTSTIPKWTFCADTPKYSAPQCSLPWGPLFSAGEIFRHVASTAPMNLWPTQQTMNPSSIQGVWGPMIRWMSYEKNMMKCSEK